MSSKASLRWSIATLPGAVILAPLVVRNLIIFEGEVDLQWADLQGVVADLGVSLVIASALIAATRFGSWLRVVGTIIVGFWSIANFANYEHIRELGSMASLSHAGYLVDPTFLQGSVLAPTHPFVLILTTLTSAALAWRGLGPDRPQKPIGPLLIGAALTTVAFAVPQTGTIASWRQTDFLSAQAVRLLKLPTAADAPTVIGHSGLAIRDLDGSPISSGAPRARNVLLVILEGVSGAYLPSFREVHGSPPLFDMPELDRLARNGLSYPSFVATQRQTNRGEFALLCGEYPKLISTEANMTELAGKGPLQCLPSVLRDAGYATVYLQAAPMAFMLKDQFMPQAGFTQTHGDDWFERSYNRNHWGVDDRAFFEQSLGMIEAFESETTPWFLTLLTVGTHHRYNVPPSFGGFHEAGSAAWAFEYLDRAIGEFVRRLDALGVLDDTLVLITSDESQATHIGAPDVENLVSQGWGLLIALLPTRETGMVDDVFVQTDIPISVADYLDLDRRGRLFNGRSVFRRYRTAREVYWGNAHLGAVAGLTLEDRLISCTEDFATCGALPVSGGRLFSPPGNRIREATPDEISWLQSAAQRSLGSYSDNLVKRRFALISPGFHAVNPAVREQYLFGGQFVSMAAHTAAEVELELAVTGASGWVEIVHLFVVNMQPSYSRSARINTGETLRLHYSANTDFSLENVECRMWITDSQGEGLGLEVLKAELNLAPFETLQQAAGVVEHRFEVTPTAPE